MYAETANTKHDTALEPAYSVGEAARYVKVSPATLRSWFAGTSYTTARGQARFEKVLKPAKAAPLTLSFSNLIEAHVLRALRTEHGVPLPAVRQALAYAERELDFDRLLLRQELMTSGGKLFLERYGEIVNLSASGQLAMRKIFEEHLKRVEWGKFRSAVRLYPFVFSERPSDRPVLIDPEISFGRPVLNEGFISTRTILERIDAGESIKDLARDYELSAAAIEAAVVFERAA